MKPTSRQVSENSGKWINAGFVVTMVVFLAIAVMAYRDIAAYLDNTKTIAKSTALRIELNSLSSSLKDVQRGARGYVISGDPKFLEPFRHGANVVTDQMERLQTLTAASPAQTRQIDLVNSLAEQMMGLSLKEVEFVRGGEADSAQATVRAGGAKLAMDSIDDIIRQLEEQEERGLNERKVRADSDFKDSLTLLGLGGVLNITVIGGIFVAMNRQVRKRREMADLVQRSEQRLQTVVNSIQEGITFSNAEGRFEIFNPRMKELTGYTMEEANRSGDFTRLLYPDPDDHQRALDGVRLAIARPGAHTSETTITTKSGAKRALRVSSQMLARFDPKMFLTTYEDITQRKRSEAALREAEEKYRSIVENAVEGIYQSTLDGRLLTANPALVRIFGYASAEELLQAVTDLKRQFYVDPDRREEFTKLVQHQGTVRGFESQAYCNDGSIIWVSENARALHDAAGKLVGFEGTLADITERKQAQEERERLFHELEAALADVKTLSGLVPICANCKKIRDDSGFWTQLEAYIQNRTNAQFSHGICPDCARELYPELYSRVKAKNGALS